MSDKTIDALERAMSALHNSQEWTSHRADRTDGRTGDGHPSFYDAIEKALDEDCKEAETRGAAAERARIVADLMKCSAAAYASGEYRIGNYVEGLANRYEDLEHLEEQPLEQQPVVDDNKCPHPGCPGVKDHVECPVCGGEHWPCRCT